MRVYDLEADVHFGEVGKEEEVDWREGGFKDVDPDDEEVETPVDVIGILGFDPKEL